MIPRAYITEWSQQVPWQTNEQVEQDLVICRALVEIFSDEWLASKLAFRGGTALHKFYLNPQPRYSEDIDLVQIAAEPFGPVIDRIRERLSFLGIPQRKQKANNNTLFYRFESEFPPVQTLRLKVETNCEPPTPPTSYNQTPHPRTAALPPRAGLKYPRPYCAGNAPAFPPASPPARPRAGGRPRATRRRCRQ